MYEYSARLLSVVDGDTVHLDVDLGCDIHTHLTVRLDGLNCPERGTTAGDTATSYTKDWFAIQAPNNLVILNTKKDRKEKYGRYLGVVWSVGAKSLNQMLLDSGNAVVYSGGKRV